MTPPYRVLPAADRDVDDQAAYLAEQAGLETALRFLDTVAFTFGRLASMPGVGERRESADPRLSGLRVWRVEGFPNHLIFYRTGENGVEVVRLLHGARDIDRIFGRESGPDEDAGE